MAACPKCSSVDTRCVDSRDNPSGERRRRYHCQTCMERFNTVEIVITSVTFKGTNLSDVVRQQVGEGGRPTDLSSFSSAHMLSELMQREIAGNKP